MSKNLTWRIAIALVVVGLFLKTVFNHNIEYRELVKHTSVFLFLFGFSAIGFLYWEKWKQQTQSRFKSQSTRGVFYYFKTALGLCIIVFSTLGLEKAGKYLNYSLRNYYLQEDTSVTIGVIVNLISIHLPNAGRENFYLIQYKVEEKMILNGLIVEYSNWDHDQNQFPEPSKRELKVNRIKGGNIQVEYSNKFPSFLRIVE